MWSLSWSIDGTRLISGHEDALMRVWDVASGQLIETVAGHNGAVIALARLPETDTLASGGGNGLARVWNIGPSTAMAAFPPSSLDPGWSHDGRYLALPQGNPLDGGDNPGLLIWDMQEERLANEYLTDHIDDYLFLNNKMQQVTGVDISLGEGTSDCFVVDDNMDVVDLGTDNVIIGNNNTVTVSSE